MSQEVFTNLFTSLLWVSFHMCRSPLSYVKYLRSAKGGPAQQHKLSENVTESNLCGSIYINIYIYLYTYIFIYIIYI